MPSLNDVARFFGAMTTADVMIGLAVTGCVLLLLPDWRFSLVALAVQYLLLTVLFSTMVQLQVALIRLISGGLVSVILYITAVRVRADWMRRARAAGWENMSEVASVFEREPFVVPLTFRAISLVLLGVSVITVANQYNFPNAPVQVWLLSLWLCSIGLMLAAFSRDALKVGLGLLTFSAGFGALYLAIEPSLLFYGLLLISDLVIALAVAHLASAPVRPPGGARRRGES